MHSSNAITDNLDAALNFWKAFLRFPSISSDPTHVADCRACANWLAGQLADMRLNARLIETSGLPIVTAEYEGDPSLPTVLFYGHYDVQPVDPLDAWHSPPFEPTLRDGRLFARGAQDNKGQLAATLTAIRDLIRRDALRVPLKILLDGEEESGSGGITDFLRHPTIPLQGDVLLVTDTGTAPSGAPTIIMGLRGLIHLTVRLTGPDHDLHSGTHGGVAPNPATALAHLLATLHDADGRIAIDGFEDDVTPPTPTEQKMVNAHPLDLNRYRSETGVPTLAGDPRFTPAERLGFRPAIDVNGIAAGYSGPGVKTIIPATAIAKVTARLAAGQDPDRALSVLRAHMEQRIPSGCRLDIPESGVGGPGFRLDPTSALVVKARRVLAALSDIEPVCLWEGASIPVVADLARVTGAEPLLVGFGREQDRAHAPNESYSLDQFRMGVRYASCILQELARS